MSVSRCPVCGNYSLVNNGAPVITCMNPRCRATFKLAYPPPPLSYPPPPYSSPPSYSPPKTEIQQRIDNYTSSSSPEGRIMLAKFQEAQSKGYDYIVPILGEDKIYQLFDTNAATEDEKEIILGPLESSESNVRYRAEDNPVIKYKFRFGKTIEGEPNVLLLKLVTLGGRRRKIKRRAKKTAKRNKNKYR